MFFKGKKKKAEKVISEVRLDKVQIMNEMESLKSQLEVTAGKEQIWLLNKLGELSYQVGEVDQAIYYYEISIAKNHSLGKAYADLLKLYNVKRRSAAEAGYDQEVQMYLEKIDDLMKLSKDVIRGLE